MGAGTFSLYSLDLGEFYSSVHSDHPDAEWVTITGTKLDGTTVTTTIFLDGIRDGREWRTRLSALRPAQHVYRPSLGHLPGVDHREP
jgi:hypothetical protein